MNFFKKKKKRDVKKEDVIISELYNLLHNCGDSILNGSTKLTLTSPVLILLNLYFQKITHGVNEPCFQVTKQGDSEQSQRLIFIFDFIQKVSSLKLVSGPVSTPSPLISVIYFKSLKHLEVRKIPIENLNNLNGVRRDLKSLTCCRSTSSVRTVINQFGEGSGKKFILPELQQLDLSYNTIETLDDDSLKLLPALENMNVSYNSLIDASSTQLPSLQSLNLGFNMINSIPEYSPALSFTLNVLVFCNNNLSTLQGLEVFTNLSSLDISSNCLSDFKSIKQLAVLEKLVNISLKGNPICFIEDYRISVIKRLSPASRISKVIFDGKTLDLTELSHLGEEVVPVSLSTYIPDEPNRLSRKSIRRVAGSVTSLPHIDISTPKLQRRSSTLKSRRRLREAKIVDSSVEKDNHTSTPKTSLTSPETPIPTVFSSRRNSTDNSVIFYKASDSTNEDRNNIPDVLDYDSFPSDKRSMSVEDDNIEDKVVANGNTNVDSSDSASSQFSIIQKQLKEHKSLEKQKSNMSIGEVERQINRSSSSSSSYSLNGDNEDVLGEIERSYDSVNSHGMDVVYLVENLKQNDTFGDIEKEFLFLYISPPYLLEKSDDGKLRTKLDLNYLKSISSTVDSQLSVILKFNLLRDEWKYRHYVFEQSDSMEMFLSIISDIFAKNSQNQSEEVVYLECLQCYNSFVKTESTVLCEKCGSNLIIEKSAQPSCSVTSDNVTSDNNSFLSCQVHSEIEGNKKLENISSSCPDFDSQLIEKNFQEKVLRRSVTEKLSNSQATNSIYKLDNVILNEPNHRKESFVRKNSRKQSSTSNFESLLNKLKYNTVSSNSSLPSINSSLQSQNMTTQVEADSAYPNITFNNISLTKETNTFEYLDFQKCNHALKLHFFTNMYSHDEDFICQLRCLTSLYNKIGLKDCLVHVSNHAVYVFSIIPRASSIEKSLEKLAFCPLQSLQALICGKYFQYFIMEFSKANCYFKFITGDMEKTKKFCMLLKEKLSQSQLADKSIFTNNTSAHVMHNIRVDIFGVEEDILCKGSRYYNWFSSQKKPLLLQNRKMRIRTFNQCFVAKEFIDWLVGLREVQSREEGVVLCEKLINKGIVSHVSKERPFSDDDGWYKFNTQQFESLPEKCYNGDNDCYSSDDDVSTTVAMYLTCNIRVNQTESDFYFRSVIVSESHIYIADECHQWPFSYIHPPPSILKKQFTVKDMVKISNITSIDLYEDVPNCCTLYVIDEVSPEDSCERTWMLHTSSSNELKELLEYIKQKWECLFAIPVPTLVHSTIRPFIEVT